jgi:hypothetical protein
VVRKFPVLFLLLLLSGRLFAQHLSGTVVDQSNMHPLAFATVTAPRVTAFTGDDGKFTLSNVHPGDTVRVSSVGYTTYIFTVYKSNDTVNVYLEQNSILLNNVSINGQRNYKADSLHLREDFAKQFNYRKPKVTDLLKTDLPGYVPNYGGATNSGTSIGGLDLLSVASLFGRGKTAGAKFQKELQQDEKDNYIDHVFSKAKVTRFTNMHGDSLTVFMRMYRPDLDLAKSMTEYELIQYIKNSFDEFLKIYDPAAERDSIFKKE